MSNFRENGKKDLSRFLQSPFNLQLAIKLPIELYRAYIYALGITYILTRKQERKITSATILSKTPRQPNVFKRYSLLLKTYQGMFEHYLEKLIIATRSPGEMSVFLKKNCEIKNKEWLERVGQRGTGAIVATGHFGANEFLPVVLALNGYNTVALTKYKTERLGEIARKRAAIYGIRLIDSNHTNFSFGKAIQAVKDGMILVTACDEFDHWVPSNNARISVFGEMCPADKGLEILYRRTKVPMCLGLMVRNHSLNKYKYTLNIHPLNEDITNPAISATTWQVLEGYIQKYPEQWYKWNTVARGLANYRLKENGPGM